MRTGLSLVGPPPPLPVMPVPMQPQQQQQPMLGIPSSLPPPPPPVPGYLRKRKPTDGNDLSLGGMNQASGARTRQKITITVLLLHTHRNTLFSLSIIIHYILFSFLFFFFLQHEELEARKKLTNIRVVQPNLVYVTNISLDFLNKVTKPIKNTNTYSIFHKSTFFLLKKRGVPVSKLHPGSFCHVKSTLDSTARSSNSQSTLTPYTTQTPRTDHPSAATSHTGATTTPQHASQPSTVRGSAGNC